MLAALALLSAAPFATLACESDGPANTPTPGPPTGGPAGARDAAVVDAPAVDAPTDTGGGGMDAAPDRPAFVSVNPERRDFSPERLAQLQVPTGFRVSVFATNLTNPRWMATLPDGTVYVTSFRLGQVTRLRDGNADGDADDPGERTVVADAMANPELMGVHGITIHQGKLYLASVKSVVSATLGADGSLSGLTVLVRDLPDGGVHPRRTIGVSPDGKLHVTIGSSCNACNEPTSENAAMLRFNLDGTPAANEANTQHPVKANNPQSMVSPRLFASGLRNTMGFGWHPMTGELWGWDHGSDGLGNDLPPEELNRIVAGKSFGWPFCFGDRMPDPKIEEPSPTTTKQTYCPTTEPVNQGYQAHSSPIGFVFYTGTQFPDAYRNDAFVAFRGSWNRDPPTGYKVVRVHFENGTPAASGATPVFSDFLTGFLFESGAAHFGRIAGLAVDGSGALLVAEDTNGIIYRVSYAATQTDGGPPPTDAPPPPDASSN